MSIAYAVAAAVSGLVPITTQGLSIATHAAWWHPGIVLAVLSLVTLVAAIVAARRRPAGDLSGPAPERELADASTVR